MSISGAQMGAGRTVMAVNKKVGGYILADGVSSWAGSVEELASNVYGRPIDLPYFDDFVDAGYKEAGSFYFGNEGYGSSMRSAMSILTALPAAFNQSSVVVSNKAYESHMIGDGFASVVMGSELRSIKSVPAYQTWGGMEILSEMISMGFNVREMSGALYGMSDSGLSDVSVTPSGN